MKKLFILAIFLVLSIYIISAEVSCPKEVVNDSYPGICGIYTDTNNNQICDLSEDTQETVKAIEIQPVLNEEKQNSLLSSNYNFILISLVTIIVYLVSYFLMKKQKISVVAHKKIWNILLLVSFLITALTSILYLVKTDLGIDTLSFSFISFWHVEIGLIMILISTFHTIWHWPYFKSYLKKEKRNNFYNRFS